MSRIVPIELPEADRRRLEELVRNRNTPQKVVWRARIVLLSADGKRPPAISAAVGKSELTVRRWRRRYLEKGVAGLLKGFFSTITRRRIRRGIFKSVADLEDAIARYIREHNRSSKPVVWTKRAETILAKIARLPAPSE